MKKRLASLVLALLSGSTATANNECRNWLQSQGDSRVFRFRASGADEINPVIATSLVQKALKSRCDKNEIPLNMVECAEISPGNATSKSCYLEAKDWGYFFVTVDLMDMATVIWNRWD